MYCIWLHVRHLRAAYSGWLFIVVADKTITTGTQQMFLLQFVQNT